jgi:hypothetical protein
MNITKQQQQLTQHHKICAAKDCASLGVYEMEILFLGKKGWFCQNCKESLTRDGLLIQQVTATRDCHPSNQGVSNIGNE